MDLKNAVVVLTGASRGIGVNIARDLGKAGAHVILAARNAEKLEAVATQVVELGGKATCVPTDVSSPSDRKALLQAAEAIGPIDVLINNAGIEYAISVMDHTAGEVEKQLAVNLHAPIELTRAVLPNMVKRGRGAIVQVSSMSGKSPTPYNAIYSATKYGLNGFTASLRIELEGTGVTAGVVCPSFVDTGMWRDSGATPPKMMKEVTGDSVAVAVRKVIDGQAEVLVTPNPVKPLLAIAQFFPDLQQTVLGWMGVTDTLKERAKLALSHREEAAK